MMDKKEYVRPIVRQREIMHHLSLLAGSIDDIPYSGEGANADHADSKPVGLFDMNNVEDEESKTDIYLSSR